MASRILHAVIEPLAEFFAKHPRWFIGGVILYVLCPIDILPEMFVGPVGYVDDTLVLLLPLLLRTYLRRRKNPAPQ